MKIATEPKTLTSPNKAQAFFTSNNYGFFGSYVQPKPSINQPNDVYEQEADAMADKVMRIAQNTFFVC